MKTENKWSAEFVKVLRSQGAMVTPLIAGQGMPVGWPDMLVVHRKWSGLVERKAESTRLESHQERVIKDLALRDFNVCVARHVGGSNLVVTMYDRNGAVAPSLSSNYEQFLDHMNEFSG